MPPRHQLKTFAIELYHDKRSYLPGESIHGIIILEPYPKQMIAKLRVGIHGISKVFWNQVRYNRQHKISKDNAENDVRNMVRYFDSEKSVFECRRASAPGPRDQRVFASMGLFGPEEFPFVFQLPDKGFPPSWRGLYGTIQYWIEAVVEVGGQEFFHQEAVQVVEMLPVVKPVVMNPKPLSQKLPVFGLVCGSSFVVMTVQLDKSSYFPGESILVTATIQNNSSWTISPRACLVRVETYATTKGSTKRLEDVLIRTSGPPVKSHCDTHWAVPTWKIPETTCISLTECAIIRNQYFVVIKLRARRLISETCKVASPLTILPLALSSSSSDVTMSERNPSFESQGTEQPDSRRRYTRRLSLDTALTSGDHDDHGGVWMAARHTDVAPTKHPLGIVREESISNAQDD